VGAPTLRIDLLGGFRVSREGNAAHRLPNARQQQILAFLILHGRRAPVPRQRIAGSLWPESTDTQALTNLRRELHQLREVAPDVESLVDAPARTLGWRDAEEVTVDLLQFERAAGRGLEGDRAALLEAATLYQGDILPDCSGDWIDGERERLRERARRVLVHLVGLLEKDRAFVDAIQHAQQLVRLDPLDEDAWCALMRCHARRGDRATALHLYQQCAALLKKELGIQPSAATRLTYREILDLDEAAPPPPAAPRSVVYPLVGRAREWHSLLDAWRTAETGHPRLVVVRGEAGIGKTRMTEELVDFCLRAEVTAISARCYAGEGRLAYAPIAAWLKHERLEPRVLALETTWLTDIARLRPDLIAGRPDVAAPSGELESWQRLRFFEALTQAFVSAAPLVMVLDDVQWADADSIEWLQYFLRAAGSAGVLVVATVRSEEEQDNAPLQRLVAHVERDGRLTVLALGPLDRQASAQLADAVAERSLDEATLARAFAETEGHPLFIIERGRMDVGEATPSGSQERSRVQSVVAARLALLSPEARTAAEVASAIGRDFRFDLLAHASDLEEAALVRALDELWRRHIVRVQADEGWDFTHDRIREVAYDGIGPARARLIHRRVAQAMESLHAPALDAVSASIAMHFDRGGQPARAVPYLERAAAVAAHVSASEEAIRCLTYALSLLESLPAGRERDQRELSIRSSLSIVLNSARGYGALEVERNLDRVMALSRVDERDEVPVRWLWVGFTLRYMLGDLKSARALAEWALARSADDASCQCEAHHAMAGALVTVGQLEDSRVHFDAALAAYDEHRPQRSALGSDLGVFAHAWYSHAVWLLGDDAAALGHVDEATALARRLKHPYSEMLALAYTALLHQMRRDVDRTLSYARDAIELSDRYGFGYYGDWARLLAGWAEGQQHPREGVASIESALVQLDAQRAQARRPYYLSLLAETHARAGNDDRARHVIDRAIAMALERVDLWWLPALYLQKSALEAPADRDGILRRALELARAQRSESLVRRILSASAVSPA
jgi:DNA-binding SARP family transcriptional activator